MKRKPRTNTREILKKKTKRLTRIASEVERKLGLSARKDFP